MNLSRLKAACLEEDFAPFDLDQSLESKLNSLKKSPSKKYNFFALSSPRSSGAPSSNNSSKNSLQQQHLRSSGSPKQQTILQNTKKSFGEPKITLDVPTDSDSSITLPPEELEEFQKVSNIKAYLAKKKEQKEEKLRQKKEQEEREAKEKKKRINLLKVTRRLRKKQRENIMESYLDNMANLMNGSCSTNNKRKGGGNPRTPHNHKNGGGGSASTPEITIHHQPDIEITDETIEMALAAGGGGGGDKSVPQSPSEGGTSNETSTTNLMELGVQGVGVVGDVKERERDPSTTKKMNLSISIDKSVDGALSPKKLLQPPLKPNNLQDEYDFSEDSPTDEKGSTIPFPKTFLPKTKSKVFLVSPKSSSAPQEAKIRGLISEYYSEDQGLEEIRQKAARMWEVVKEAVCVETEGDSFNLKKLFMQEKKRKEEEEKKRIMKNSKILFALGRQRGLLPKTLEKAIIKVVGVSRVPKENEVFQDPKEYYKTLKLQYQRQKAAMNPMLSSKVTEPTFLENSYTPRIIKRTTSSRIISVTSDLSRNNSSTDKIVQQQQLINNNNNNNNNSGGGGDNNMLFEDLLRKDTSNEDNDENSDYEKRVPTPPSLPIQTTQSQENVEGSGSGNLTPQRKLSIEERASLFKRRMKETYMNEGVPFPQMMMKRKADPTISVTPPEGEGGLQPAPQLNTIGDGTAIGTVPGNAQNGGLGRTKGAEEFRKSQMSRILTERKLQIVFPYTPKRADLERQQDRLSQKFSELMYDEILSGNACFLNKDKGKHENSFRSKTTKQWKTIKQDLEKCLRDIRELSAEDEKVLEATIKEKMIQQAGKDTSGSTLVLSFQKLIRKNDQFKGNANNCEKPIQKKTTHSKAKKGQTKGQRNVNKILRDLDKAKIPPPAKNELYV